MAKEIILDETIEVVRPIHEVFAYVADFSRIEEWDPGVGHSKRLTQGRLGVGSQFEVTMNFGLRLVYQAVEWQDNQRVLFHVTSKAFTAVEEITFTEVDGKTRVRYLAKFTFPALFRLMAEKFPNVMDKVGKSALAGMKAALEDQFPVPTASRASEIADKLVVPGLSKFTRFGYSSQKKKWNAISAYQPGRHYVITGATSGLGLATADVLAQRGAGLTLVARNPDKGAKIVKDLIEKSGNPDIRLELADLSLIADTKALADRLLAKNERIDALVNNAGALINPREVTSEGLEKSFALLLLSPAILTEKLLPLFRQTASQQQPVRVINVLSGGMYAEKIKPQDLQFEQDTYSGSVAYARAKRGLMILTEEWAKMWEHEHIMVNAMHPGWADTPGVVEALPEFHRITEKVLRTPAEGADTIIWLACAREAGLVSGQFWLDRTPHTTHIFSQTVESPEERAEFLARITEYTKGA